MYKCLIRFLIKLYLSMILCSLIIINQSAAFPGIDKVEPALLSALAENNAARYLIYMKDQADLSEAATIAERDQLGEFVYQRLRAVAESSQAPILNFLDHEVQSKRATGIKTFISANAIGVTSTQTTLERIAAFAGVERIMLMRFKKIPEPELAAARATVDGVEWNIAKVQAPKVWAEGITGNGIVVANIDSGVQYDHPALANQYRGKAGSSYMIMIDNNYNWWDPSKVCPNPKVPCDNNGHGTHTMGTMVGDDGGSNQIGVAPGAKWIACKGCENRSCSEDALLECADFMLAPWDLNKANPDPAKRPHVVNNSWGGSGGDSWYQKVVQNWRAAGIFPAFSVGNEGESGCHTAGSPGDYPESFATGATDSSDAIASFSSRGPSVFGAKKPDWVAPGENVRSSVPTNSYASYSGTSMASPHTAGIVALLWQRFPSLERDVSGTEKKLRPATTIFNTSQGCGDDGPRTHPNNVYGWGRADAYQGFNPLNIYTNQSTYIGSETMQIRLSLVNPDNSATPVDIYVAVAAPGGLFFYSSEGLGTSPVPWVSNFTMPPLGEYFDHSLLNHPMRGVSPASYTWFSVLVNPGADPLDSANWLSFDQAPFQRD